jgi:hypothetical protein
MPCAKDLRDFLEEYSNVLPISPYLSALNTYFDSFILLSNNGPVSYVWLYEYYMSVLNCNIL